MRCAVHMRKKRHSYILVAKPEGKRPPGKNSSKPVDNIKMDLKEMRSKNVNSFKRLVTHSGEL